MPSFVPPKNAPDFIKKVEDKCHALISLGIWDLDRTRLDSWLDQFTTDEESYFAACVLDALAYRPKEQFSASLKALLRGGVRWHLQDGLPGVSDCDLERALANGTFTTAVITPAIDEESPPTKSGPFVLRRMKKVLGTNTSLMKWPWHVRGLVMSSQVDTVIVVDDFLGTGSQLAGYLERHFASRLPDGKSALPPGVNWIYLTAVAHKSGLAHLAELYPNLKVFTAELLDDGHGFFQDRYWSSVSGSLITGAEAKQFYLDFLKQKGLSHNAGSTSFFDVHPHGYGDLALCFGFEHGTPDNSLPILWCSQNGWRPLLDR